MEAESVKERAVGRPKKDGEFLNCYIRRDVSERLTEFCKVTGLSKTMSVEKALCHYLDDHDSLESIEVKDGGY